MGGVLLVQGILGGVYISSGRGLLYISSENFSRSIYQGYIGVYNSGRCVCLFWQGFILVLKILGGVYISSENYRRGVYQFLYGCILVLRILGGVYISCGMGFFSSEDSGRVVYQFWQGCILVLRFLGGVYIISGRGVSQF